jgi:amidase
MAYDGIDDFATAGAGELASALADRRVSAVELFEAAVARIEAMDGPINAVVVRDFDRAREAAVAADAALSRGERAPLLGVPMTVKEAFNVAGLPTTWGLEAARDWIATEDATVVTRLKAAGAIIVGKTNVPPNLGDWQSVNPVYGRTNNPHDPSRSPGGSSGGSAAALATGMVPLEFGSDIGGSIRVPSAFCGVYGHKPSYGLVSQRGHAPPGLDGLPPLLGVVGPLARCVADLELALSVTAGPEADEAVGYRLALPEPRHDTLAGYRVMILDAHPLAPVDREIREAIAGLADRLSDAGVQVSRDHAGLPDLVDAHGGYMRMLLTALSYGAPPGPQAPSFHAWMDMQNHQLAVRRKWRAVFQAVDVVIAPTLGVVAFPHMEGEWNDRRLIIDGEPRPFVDQIAWAGVATYANLPATAVPIGRTAAGLPIGVQIVGPYLEDRTTLAFAKLIEAL